MPIIDPHAANVAYPGWKIWDGDDFIAKPGNVGNKTPVEPAHLAFFTNQWFVVRLFHII